jgi:MFS family permease
MRMLAMLWALYFVQGLPFGYQATALPVVLRERGMSLTGVGLAGALALPWLLKPLWAPLVDRYGSLRFGRRRSWLLPTQLALMGTCLAAATIGTRSLMALLWLVFAMNACAATMDIAVDGLAIDLLRPRDLGIANIAQVVGYKLGMLTGGGLLLWASGRIGESGMFVAMAAMVLLVGIATLAFREPPPRAGEGAHHLRVGEVLTALLGALKRSGAGWLLLFVASYKLGESMADAMFKPFVLDLGYAKEQIGLWIGTWGMLASLIGSLLGGLLASRQPLLRAVWITAVLRAGPLAAQWWLSLADQVTPNMVIGVTCAEHLAGGALTTAMFAFMMSRVDRRIGATHYTLLAAVEVLGKAPAAWASGVIADAAGYPTLFATALVLSLLYLGLWWPVRRHHGEAVVA